MTTVRCRRCGRVVGSLPWRLYGIGEDCYGLERLGIPATNPPDRDDPDLLDLLELDGQE